MLTHKAIHQVNNKNYITFNFNYDDKALNYLNEKLLCPRKQKEVCY